MRRHKFFYLLLITVLASACIGASITPPTQSPELTRLLQVNQREIALNVSILDDCSSYGSQYLFFILPLTRIQVTNPKAEVEAAFISALAEAGYKIVPKNRANYTLEVTLNDLSLQGYDYFFVRRPWCSATLAAKIFKSSGDLLRYAVVTESDGEFAKFAFEPELSRVLRQVLRSSAKEILAKLSL